MTDSKGDFWFSSLSVSLSWSDCWRKEKCCCQAMLRIRGSLKELGKRIAPRSSSEGDLSAHHCSSGVEIRLCVSELGGGRGRLLQGAGWPWNRSLVPCGWSITRFSHSGSCTALTPIGMLAIKDLASGTERPPTSAVVLLKGSKVAALFPWGQFTSNSVLFFSLSHTYRCITSSQRPKWLKISWSEQEFPLKTRLTGVPPALFESVSQFSHSVMFNSVTPLTAAHQASLSITNSWSILKIMSIESVMPYNHLILCCPLLPPSIFPSIRAFFSESVLHIRWPKYWEFQLQHQSI